MKNLLRKLHIGNDHYDRLDEDRTSPDETPTASSSSSSTGSSPFEQQRHSGFGWRRRNSRPVVAGSTTEQQVEAARPMDTTGMATIDELEVEEEYQVQLALALSVSKSEGLDPEVIEIEAAKRISLGLSPSPDNKQAEVITGRYWAYDVLSYEDKVVDGFYDIYSYAGPLAFDKLPSIIELQEMEVSESVTFEVILVNRVIDHELFKLEQRAMCLKLDCSVLDPNPIRNGLVQRIAELVIEEMGGVVSSDIEILASWREKGWVLRDALQSIVWPLGMLRIGLARHRALLFKVLADCVGLPCRLVKGKHYTGVEDGVLNILKGDDGREHIIDLMGTPGTLIPFDIEVASNSGSVHGTTQKDINNGQTDSPSEESLLKKASSSFSSNEQILADTSQRVRPVLINCEVTLPDTVNMGKEAHMKRSYPEAGPCISTVDNTPVQKRKEQSFGSLRDRFDSPKYRSYGRHSSLLDDVAEWEINWEDLHIGERIGIGSYGEVYHGEWKGNEVAVKKFLDQDLSGDAMDEFRSEVRIMRRLKHPNVVSFMGAVAHSPNLAIVTEYLPRGSLFRLLHRPYNQLDRRRRLQMALDVAKGMNYLHSATPVVVHRDLKSPNLLVDKNWVVKVCDFGLSRIKHSTFLSSKSTAGTPEWMAPEVLRNEPSNEKSDVFSFGVILWELATSQKPWHAMNPMQVVGAVGFQNKRLQIPSDVDPSIASIIHECWQNDPSLRPSFDKIVNDLQVLQRPVVHVGQASSSNNTSNTASNSTSYKPNHQLKVHYQQQLHAVPLKGVAFNVDAVGNHTTTTTSTTTARA